MIMDVSFQLACWVGILSILLSWIAYEYSMVWWKWERLRGKLRTQGIKGPPPSLLYASNVPQMQKLQSQPRSPPLSAANHGNLLVSYDYISDLFPYFEHWRKQYGMYLTNHFC